jgi:hypothetical protein
MDFYLKNGRRWSAYEGFLKEIIESRNSLTVKRYATVTRVCNDYWISHVMIIDHGYEIIMQMNM